MQWKESSDPGAVHCCEPRFCIGISLHKTPSFNIVEILVKISVHRAPSYYTPRLPLFNRWFVCPSIFLETFWGQNLSGLWQLFPVPDDYIYIFHPTISSCSDHQGHKNQVLFIKKNWKKILFKIMISKLDSKIQFCSHYSLSVSEICNLHTSSMFRFYLKIYSLQILREWSWQRARSDWKPQRRLSSDSTSPSWLITIKTNLYLRLYTLHSKLYTLYSIVHILCFIGRRLLTVLKVHIPIGECVTWVGFLGQHWLSKSWYYLGG